MDDTFDDVSKYSICCKVLQLVEKSWSDCLNIEKFYHSAGTREAGFPVGIQK